MSSKVEYEDSYVSHQTATCVWHDEVMRIETMDFSDLLLVEKLHFMEFHERRDFQNSRNHACAFLLCLNLVGKDRKKEKKRNALFSIIISHEEGRIKLSM